MQQSGVELSAPYAAQFYRRKNLNMKRLAIFAALFLFVVPFTASAQTSIEELAKSAGKAFTAKSLGKLDAEQPSAGRVKIVIEHSLAEDGSSDQFKTRSFSNFAKAEKWLRSMEHDGLPNRNVMPLIACKKGICSYSFKGGILHNNLYLKRITYGYAKGRPYIKTILILDGD